MAHGLDVYLLNVVGAVRIVTADHGEAGGLARSSTYHRLGIRARAMFADVPVFRAGLAAYTKLFARSIRGRTTCA